MVDIRLDRTVWFRAALAGAVIALCQGAWAEAQGPGPGLGPGLSSGLPALPGGAEPGLPPSVPTPGLTGMTGKEQVVDVRVEGVDEKDLHRVVKYIRTHAGRPFDRLTVENDVKRLLNSKRFASALPSYQRVDENGLIVIFRVVERPTIRYVKYVGNTIAKRHLDKKTKLKPGDPLDAYAVDEGRRALQEYYQEKGFNKVSVQIIEGTKPKDRGVVFLINEGVKQKVWKVEFQNNTIASDGRLKTQISSKPPILYLFKGEVDREKIDEDVRKLTDYYRALGFFKARVGRELIYSESQKWVTLRFIIDEGPRYSVRNVSFVGAERFKGEELLKDTELKQQDFFDKGKLDHDVTLMQDMYGGDGYVFAVIEAEPRFQPDSNQLDLVYKIEEGERYAVGAVNVKIVGDNPHTRRNTILNRVSLHPGDILDTRELRASERRLKASNLFANKSPAEEPKITFERPDLGLERLVENPDAPSTPRGQSPDNVRTPAGRRMLPPAPAWGRQPRVYPPSRGRGGAP
ncbi:MAG TPA: POTRA domain-containing protein [Pirellulales bacterium]|nr:POTRA domain-containing protein [Pirellulales bacterium]